MLEVSNNRLTALNNRPVVLLALSANCDTVIHNTNRICSMMEDFEFPCEPESFVVAGQMADFRALPTRKEPESRPSGCQKPPSSTSSTYLQEPCSNLVQFSPRKVSEIGPPLAGSTRPLAPLTGQASTASPNLGHFSQGKSALN